jgi:glyoxylase-like metal-dependent hydrolase (beta-lactamase superfamily II)
MSATQHARPLPSGLNVAPLEPPLEGGQAGATVTLHPLLCAVMRGPRAWFERVEGRMAGLKAIGIGVPADGIVDVPVVAFLLEHPSAGPVLVDTGFHRVVAEGSSRARSHNLGSVARLMTRNMRMEPGQAVAAQLRERGFDPRELAAIVMTHLHFDHASALPEFPGATVLVSRPEWDAAHARNPFMHGYVPTHLDPQLSYRTLEFAGDEPPTDGLGSTLDLFGDGSITLVFTPGHTLGHMSLIGRLSEREALLTGDAAYTMATLQEGARPWRMEDPRAFEQSVRSLASWCRAHPDAVVIPGHDMPAWERLEQSYS